MKRIGTCSPACRRSVLLTLIASAFLFCAQVSAQVNVVTWHNDNLRTGQNTSEGFLNSGTVKTTVFGKVCSASVDGQVYAQPLSVSNLTINGTKYKNVVYVVTENDSVYAFDGTNCNSILPKMTLLQTGEAPADCHHIGGGGCKTVAPAVGILGTPAIDLSTNTLYVAAESQFPATTPTTWFHRLHALDITTLAEKFSGPAVINGTFGSMTFTPQEQIQRPGLLFVPTQTVGVSGIYVAFSMMDGAPAPHPSGWVFAYNGQNLADPKYPKIYATTPVATAEGGGIWQGGGALAIGADGSGKSFLYFSTGDGTFDLTSPPLTTQDAGNTFVKMMPDLTKIGGFFTPSDQFWRACLANDADYGSGGVMLIPDKTLSNYPYVALKGDKEGFIWAIDRANPGGYNGTSCTPSCTSKCTNPNNNLQTVAAPGNGLIHNNPAFWKGSTSAYIYNVASGKPLVQYPLCNTAGPICTSGTYLQTSNTFSYGATPAVSSMGTSNGIVWTIENFGNVSGGKAAILYAYDATSLTTLYHSDACPKRDTPGAATKFSVPTIANGFVYIGTQTDFDIYGATAAICN